MVAKKKEAAEATTGYSGKFVGKYVQDVRTMTEAALVTGLHGLMIGAPGFGKTQIVMDVMNKVIPGQYVFQRLDPSTPPSALKPRRELVLVDGKEALISNPQGTMYQPGMRGGIMDEMGRANSASFDAMLDLFDREDIEFGEQIIVGTANFMPTSERQSALIDRIAFWQWVSPDAIKPGEMVTSQLMNLNAPKFTGGEVLTLKEIDWVRGLTPTKKSAEVVSAFVEMIAAEARKADFEVNPRRIFQWSMAGFKYNAHVQKTHDFDHMAPEAAYIFRWLMPCLSKNDYDKWQNLAKAFADIVGTACEEVVKALKFEIAKMDKTGDLATSGAILATKFTAARRSLEERFPDDPKVKKTVAQINAIYNETINGFGK